jgi:glycerol-3-phosphate O-acyltransferase
MQMSSTTVLRFGRPMDPFGNLVDRDGTSHDRRGRAVDPTSYVRKALTGKICHDASRDKQYTRHTGECVRRAFLENTVLMPAHIVAYVLFELLQRKFPRWDVYRLLRLAGGEVIAWRRVHDVLDELLLELKEREGRDEFRLSPFLRDHTREEILEEGISYLRTYHIPELIEPMMNGVMLNKLDLLYYYGNRVRSYPIELDAIFSRIEG